MVDVEPVDSVNGDKKTDGIVDQDVIHERIIAQVEYYFSDVNLARDRFMQQQTKLDEGWIPLDTLMKFHRLAAIVADRDKSAIIEALQKSDLIEVNDDSSKVRRSGTHPLPEMYEELRKALMKRTVYCKGFPLEGITFDQLLDFFKSFGKVDSVIMRHFQDRATKKRGFKGSAFVIFPSVEDADIFLKLDQVKYNDTVLVRKWQSDYIEGKRKERLEEKLNRQQRRRDNKRSKGGIKTEGGEDDDEKEAGGAGTSSTEQKEERGGFPLGAVLHVTGISESSDLHRDQIREAVESLGLPVAFIDLNQGDTSGYVRLENANTAAQLVSKVKDEMGGKLKVGGGTGSSEELELRALEGEEEKNFLDRARKEINKKRQNNKSRRKHRGGGRGGHFGDRGRKRKGGPTDGPPPPKSTPAASAD